MSTFYPTSILMDPPDQPDQLATAVIQSLSRPLLRKRPWGIFKTFIFGGISFGILPLLIWPRRFKDWIVAEQQQYWHLAEWIRLRTGNSDAVKLRDIAEGMRFRMIPWIVSVLCLAGIVYTFWPVVSSGWFHQPELLAATYHFPRFDEYQSSLSQDDARPLFVVWTGGLCVAYLMHWLQVKLHEAQVRKFVRAFNRIAQPEGAPPVNVQMSQGFYLMWLGAAVLAMMGGAIWALPVAAAGAAHGRYVTLTSRTVRADLSRRVQSMIRGDRPPLDVPHPVFLRVACANDRCKATLPPGAKFCPRCGDKV